MSFLRSARHAILLANSLNNLNAATTRRNVKRWVAPTLRELAHRSKKLGPQEPAPRSDYIEWNYRAELFAFGKRLNEEFQMPLLQTACTNNSYVQREAAKQRELGVEDADIQLQDNTDLAAKGAHISKQYIEAFLKHSLPKLPAAGLEAYSAYLLSTDTLAHVATHLGMKDLVYAAEYPPAAETLAKSLHAVIGALADSSGVERAFLFVRDFICTQLSQKDLLELWQPEEPLNLLKDICAERKLGAPEPRLLGDCAKNTVLAAYHVGIYANKQLLGKGFGENTQTATETAAIDALQTLYDIHDSRKPFNFQLQVETKNVKLEA